MPRCITVRGYKQGTSLSCESGVYFVVNANELPTVCIFALLLDLENGWWVCLNWVKAY